MPYNGDPEAVEVIEGARESLDRLRAAGLRVGVLSNQSGVGRKMISMADVNAVNARIETLLGPFDGWFVCPHSPEENCDCRKPKPKLVFDAAIRWGIDAHDIAVIGDKESDVQVAHNAGGIGIRIGAGRTLVQAVDEILSAWS